MKVQFETVKEAGEKIKITAWFKAPGMLSLFIVQPKSLKYELFM